MVPAALFPEIASRPFVLLMFFLSPLCFHDRLIFYREIGTAARGQGTHLLQDRADKTTGSRVLNTPPFASPWAKCYWKHSGFLRCSERALGFEWNAVCTCKTGGLKFLDLQVSASQRAGVMNCIGMAAVMAPCVLPVPGIPTVFLDLKISLF